MPVVGKISPSLEDYIEVIFDLIRKNGIARVKDVAQKKNVAMASVNNALKRLVKEGLLNHETYKSISLTPKGAALAKKLIKRHNVLRKFLEEIINVDPEIANADACAIEHHIHKETIDALIHYVSGTADEFENNSNFYLSDVRPKRRCRVIRVKAKGEIKQRLMEMGIHEGEEITVERIAPLGDPIGIRIKDYKLSLRKNEASLIEVEKID